MILWIIINFELEDIMKAFQELNELFESALHFINDLDYNHTDENIELKKKILRKFDEENEVIKNMYVEYFAGLEKSEMKEIFLNCDVDTLRYICKYLAEGRELFEICQVVKEVLEERILPL